MFPPPSALARGGQRLAGAPPAGGERGQGDKSQTFLITAEYCKPPAPCRPCAFSRAAPETATVRLLFSLFFRSRLFRQKRRKPSSENQALKTQLLSICAGDIVKEQRSLMNLGACIMALSEGKAGHIPFRDSKLTMLLASSLGQILTSDPSHCP